MSNPPYPVNKAGFSFSFFNPFLCTRNMGTRTDATAVPDIGFDLDFDFDFLPQKR
jgi:hypothetical protein